MTTDVLLARAQASAARGAAYSTLLRPASARLPLLVLLGASVRVRPDGAHLAGCVVLVLAAYGLAAAYNDLRDIEVDRINGRELPLVTGVLDDADARRVLAGCALAVVGSQVLLDQPRGLLVTVVAVAISVAYSHPLLAIAGRGLWATASLAIAYVGLPLVLAGPPPGPPRVAAALLATMAMLLYKDVKDEVGDRAMGKRTPLVRWGARAVDRIATTLLVVAVAAAALAAPRWPALVLLAALATQRGMVAADGRRGRPLLALQCLVVAGAVALAAV